MASSMQSTGNKSESQDKNQKEKNGVRADKGSGYFPITDLQFDVMTIITEKCKALQAYDKYLLDAQPNKELLEIFESIRKTDKEQIEQLKKFVGNC